MPYSRIAWAAEPITIVFASESGNSEKLAGDLAKAARKHGLKPTIIDMADLGRAGEEIDACKAAGIAVEVVPGITAAQGAAAALGPPLTDRAHARRLQYVTGHAKDGQLPTDIDWRSLADPSTTTAIYMPTRTLAALVERAVAEGLDPETASLAIARATRPDQAVVAAPIGALAQRLAQAELPGPVLVMLGRVIGGSAYAEVAVAAEGAAAANSAAAGRRRG